MESMSKTKSINSIKIVTIIVLAIAYGAYRYFNENIQATGIFLGFLIGYAGIFTALFQNQIISKFCSPLLEVRPREMDPAEIFTMIVRNPQTGQPITIQCSKSYNLSIKNKGFSSAKNLRVKVRDGENTSWLNLRRPFTISDIYIKTLFSEEEENFTFGSLDSNSKTFYLTPASLAQPNNQTIVIPVNGEKEYNLEIVADNARPRSFKVKINNVGAQFNISNIKILQKRCRWFTKEWREVNCKR